MIDLDELKRENPKGRLWERCAQLGITSPRIRHREVDERHQVELELDFMEWELASGSHSGESRRVAEHLAARQLLVDLEEFAKELRPATPSPESAIPEDDVFDVSDEQAGELVRTNAKGRLFEWTQRQKPQVARPKFEARLSGGLVYVRAKLRRLELESPWFRSTRRKIAEHAAAESLHALVAEQASATKASEP